MKKRAVVLIMTIGFIAVLSALILQTVSISKNSLDDLMRIKVQNQLMQFMSDFQDMIKLYDPKDFKEYFVDKGIVPINDEKSGVNISISCQALDSRVNLNRLLLCNKEECDDLIREFASEYELADSEYFLALLKDSVDTNSTSERASGSKIKLYDPNFSDGCIINYESIEQIKNYYYKELKDNNIFKITKEKFLDVFYLFDKRTDANVSSPTDALSKALGCAENDDNCKDKFQNLVSNIKESLKNNSSCAIGDKNNTIQTKYLIQCSIDYYLGDDTHGVVFKYNIGEKRLESIDEFF